MVNKLIDPMRKKKTGKIENISCINSEIANYALIFVNSLDEFKRKKFKKMIENGINTGESIAKLYGIPVKEFMNEVKAII